MDIGRSPRRIHEHLASGAVLRSDDPAVLTVPIEANPDEIDAFRTVRKLESRVSQNVSFEVGITPSWRNGHGAKLCSSKAAEIS
jgi:hypothetical protein